MWSTVHAYYIIIILYTSGTVGYFDIGGESVKIIVHSPTKILLRIEFFHLTQC